MHEPQATAYLFLEIAFAKKLAYACMSGVFAHAENINSNSLEMYP